MKIAVMKETAPGERRVAATPETVRKFLALGAQVAVEEGAGLRADVPDAEFAAAGALVGSRAQVLDGADLVLAVQGPAPEGIPAGALVLAMLNPYQSRDRLEAYAAVGIDAVALEFIPRITRAQSMDVLSSQANLAGYKAVIDAAHAYGRAFPMMMTAAGTVPAARVFVMGVGVAGLQAIATAKRLGAIVSATDVRPATREQILSLGGKPVFVEDEEAAEAETAGGYAREMSEAYRAKQAALISETIAKQDIVITTALIPGRPAPRLVTAEQIATMRPGSVIVDMSVVQGGNVEGSRADETVVTENGVTILGFSNYPSRMASTASALFARNLLNFVQTFWDPEAKALKLPEGDEIVTGALVVKGGAIIHPALQG
ncbi:MAG: Re/Si-specific NAD(P)(+) transhydrogenase subunit alpha [Sphingomonadaceae bacterium]|uniref:Re/Si-specific NAD(P)(+) transhydrogenase subunit alpha n=1 Tax=Thermaurantiacus sp. TaxID=2820283 RepID=UPI00298EE792|nr:Re/Si-specific NAD(P)(+) transhydrogenase subunit alpha [Thermaurantiacus sp.]MCS6986810.1 Re/Si-specific NAD(P)(+) transhydrogenase subunit alpha [Sphingomonadaceae bacterium]MDW8413927.1 Re/Si-specific NAD(P)(+) transhydrogenase subunit alpha [Thermaurantiacus sp.]